MVLVPYAPSRPLSFLFFGLPTRPLPFFQVLRNSSCGLLSFLERGLSTYMCQCACERNREGYTACRERTLVQRSWFLTFLGSGDDASCVKREKWEETPTTANLEYLLAGFRPQRTFHSPRLPAFLVLAQLHSFGAETRDLEYGGVCFGFDKISRH